jgi:hypothetical protein
VRMAAVRKLPTPKHSDKKKVQLCTSAAETKFPKKQATTF